MPIPAVHPTHLHGVPIPYETPVVVLRTLVQTPGPAAWAACYALGASGDPLARTVLVGLTHHAQWSFRRSAIEALGLCDAPPSEVICAALTDSVPYVIRAACAVVQHHHLLPARAAVLRVLPMADPATRQSALAALASVWQPSDFWLVLDIMQTDSVP